MPLLDHFHPPLKGRRNWESFHATWIVALADALTLRWLPEGFITEVQTHNATRVEIDVATYQEEPTPRGPGHNGPATATMPVKVWSPPAPAFSLPACFPDTFEVRVYSTGDGLTLAGAIELVSPGNKDRPSERAAFTSKCAGYLSQGVSLIVIDIVTSLRANLHNELLGLLEASPDRLMSPAAVLYAAAYRPVRRGEKDELDIWPAALAVGDSLPTLPLRLTGDFFVPVELEETYADVCRRRRLI